MDVGNYVRTENGLIGKIIGFKGDMVETDNKRLITYKNDHSECKIKERPIELIEVGDYVKSTDGIEGKVEIVMPPLKLFIDGEEILYDEIKSILTKEQFESMEYNLGE